MVVSVFAYQKEIQTALRKWYWNGHGMEWELETPPPPSFLILCIKWSRWACVFVLKTWLYCQSQDKLKVLLESEVHKGGISRNFSRWKFYLSTLKVALSGEKKLRITDSTQKFCNTLRLHPDTSLEGFCIRQSLTKLKKGDGFWGRRKSPIKLLSIMKLRTSDLHFARIVCHSQSQCGVASNSCSSFQFFHRCTLRLAFASFVQSQPQFLHWQAYFWTAQCHNSTCSKHQCHMVKYRTLQAHMVQHGKLLGPPFMLHRANERISVSIVRNLFS